MSTSSCSPLAIHGGPKAVDSENEDIFRWPIITKEDEDAALEVLRRGAMSLNDVTLQFEKEYAAWTGSTYALAYPNGTESLCAAMWAAGISLGDEVICPSMTYWASCAQVLQLGAVVHFCDIRRDTLCIDHNDIEHRISPRTKAIIVVHYAGHPCEMDEITKIARKHGLKIIEDVSHAHGTLYKGRHVGTIGDVAGMSMMSGKSFPVGEGGMLLTSDRKIYERALAYGFYERTGANRWVKNQISIDDSLRRFSGIPLGARKHRINQIASAIGRVQLRHYPERIAEIQKAMNHFWDLLKGVPGIRPHRVTPDSGSTMGGWYSARGLYRPEELDGLPLEKYVEAVVAEGSQTGIGANRPLHLHPYFTEADIFGHGKPTSIAFGSRDVRQGPGSLPVSESINDIAFGIPWFKRDDATEIEKHANAFRKVAENAKLLKRT